VSVAETSLKAYRDPKNQWKFVRKADIIHFYVAINRDCTQGRICKALNMKEHCVSGRCSDLVDEGRLIVTGQKNCEYSEGRLRNTYRIVEAVNV
jgi:hypothetical protein